MGCWIEVCKLAQRHEPIGSSGQSDPGMEHVAAMCGHEHIVAELALR